MHAGAIQSCPSGGYEELSTGAHDDQSASSMPPLPTTRLRSRDVNGWAIAAGVGVLAIAAVRELVRWRGRRWQKSGPRGTD